MSSSLYWFGPSADFDHHLSLTDACRKHLSWWSPHIHPNAAGWGVKGMTVPSAAPNLRDVCLIKPSAIMHASSNASTLIESCTSSGSRGNSTRLSQKEVQEHLCLCAQQTGVAQQAFSNLEQGEYIRNSGAGWWVQDIHKASIHQDCIRCMSGYYFQSIKDSLLLIRYTC